MKALFKLFFAVVSIQIFTSCNTGPKPIDYGNDGCHYCKMTIVDKIHGAELVTNTGKIFKFDATECVINYMADDKELETGAILTNYYESPTAFITTEEATFLISEKLPSPMGANLTAFKTKASAEEIRLEKGGTLYTWNDLKALLNK
jgi:copper chaperone NosL